MSESGVLEGVREYAEGYEVKIDYVGDRPVVAAMCKAGYDRTLVDLLDLLEWVKANKPELL